jgi:hypothetical protein
MATDVDDIYERVQKQVDVKDRDIQEKIIGWLTKPKETPKKGKVNLTEKIVQKYKENARDIVDKYVNRQDLAGLKRESFSDSVLQQVRDSQLYNLAAYKFRQARDSSNISALRELRDQIKGTVAQSDWTSEIEKQIERISQNG